MANRFKTNHDVVDFTDPAALTAVPAKVEKIEEAPQEVRQQEAQPNDILADLTPGEKPKAKSYGFYLDDDVVKALDRLAKDKRSNRSKMLNTLLRKVLLGE